MISVGWLLNNGDIKYSVNTNIASLIFFGRCRRTRYKVRNAIREISKYCGNYFDRARQNTLKRFCVFKKDVMDVKITQKIILMAGVEIVTAFQKPTTVLVPTACKHSTLIYMQKPLAAAPRRKQRLTAG